MLGSFTSAPHELAGGVFDFGRRLGASTALLFQHLKALRFPKAPEPKPLNRNLSAEGLKSAFGSSSPESPEALSQDSSECNTPTPQHTHPLS